MKKIIPMILIPILICSCSNEVADNHTTESKPVTAIPKNQNLNVKNKTKSPNSATEKIAKPIIVENIAEAVEGTEDDLAFALSDKQERCKNVVTEWTEEDWDWFYDNFKSSDPEGRDELLQAIQKSISSPMTKEQSEEIADKLAELSKSIEQPRNSGAFDLIFFALDYYTKAGKFIKGAELASDYADRVAEVETFDLDRCELPLNMYIWGKHYNEADNYIKTTAQKYNLTLSEIVDIKYFKATSYIGFPSKGVEGNQDAFNQAAVALYFDPNASEELKSKLTKTGIRINKKSPATKKAIDEYRAKGYDVDSLIQKLR